MNSNFTILKADWPEIFKSAANAEKYALSDFRASLLYSRLTLETALLRIFNTDEHLEKPMEASINNMLLDPTFKSLVPLPLWNDMDAIRKVGNFGVHGRPVTMKDAEVIITNLYYFTKWFVKSYSLHEVSMPGIFNWEYIIDDNKLVKQTTKELTALQEKHNLALSKMAIELEDQRKKSEEMQQANALYKLQIEQLQTTFEENRTAANTNVEIINPRSEKDTRHYLIDVALRDAGWNLEDAKVIEYKIDNMPLSMAPSGKGSIDYVLWDDDGLPLAVVEAKRTMEHATKGENQAQIYAECLESKFGRKPVMFYTNGFDIYLWDDQFYKTARKVSGFYSKEELQRVMFRRSNRKDIKTQAIDTTIVERPYQLRAIKSVAERFSGQDKRECKLIGTERRALLVLATGTGKTRVSIAFSKLLLECNWAKRILFLADRVTLVKQAKNNFVKLMPDHSCVNLIEERDNKDARIAFSTYATMMNLIDIVKSDQGRKYGIAHFDLIIIDEAHRSIYKKYQAIFNYFDALYLGLTATPKENIDKNTFEAFDLSNGNPTDTYTLREAVENGHLVDYKEMPLTTAFTRDGIRFADLSDEEKEEYENEILDGGHGTEDDRIDANALNEWLFNEPTTIELLSYVLKHGIKNKSGEELGKTIIFARNQKHARFIKEVFLKLDKELFSNDYVKVITHNEPGSQTMIERFADEEALRLPQIAISVDMMDTGVDAPSVVNLVFYKPVRSISKFWQMIGRGTRLRPNLFGEGLDKKYFLIFDFFGNFEFFNEHPDEADTGIEKSLIEIIFTTKMKLANLISTNNSQENTELHNFRETLLNECYTEIAKLDKSRFAVNLQLRKLLQYTEGGRTSWSNLSDYDVREIIENLVPLVKPEAGDSDLSRFFDKQMYQLMIRRIENQVTAMFLNSSSVLITNVKRVCENLLKKTSIPAINTRKEILQLPLTNEFWRIEGSLSHLEDLRIELRPLMKHLDVTQQRYIVTHFKDELILNESIEDEFTGILANDGELGPYTKFNATRRRIEEIVLKNKDHIVIYKLRNAITITPQELKVLEDMLFQDAESKMLLEKELGYKIDLKVFVLGLTGLSEEYVNQSFADFVNKYKLNSKQIHFLDLIKQFFVSRGSLAVETLYERPFIDIHNQGIEGIFDDEQSDRIVKIVREINGVG
jgi:type I restriction enzyme, R subunit